MMENLSLSDETQRYYYDQINGKHVVNFYIHFG